MSDDKKIIDKNGFPIKIGESVRFFAKKDEGSEPRQGFVRISGLEKDILSVYVWIDAWSSYGREPIQWPLTWDEGKQAYRAHHTNEDGEVTWLEREPDAYAFEQPLETWPDLLTTLTVNYMKEEGVSFALRGSVLEMVQVADPNGLLGALVYQSEKRMSEIFGEGGLLPVVYYAHPNALAYLSFDFEETTTSNSKNSLYYHTHFLLETLTRLSEDARNNPENLIDGAIPLDNIVNEWLMAARNKKIKVLPYRPFPESGIDGGGSAKPTGGKIHG